jgi:putative Ca2+/H+ antiporter (TMEM165/GDT1 family)
VSTVFLARWDDRTNIANILGASVDAGTADIV